MRDIAEWISAGVTEYCGELQTSPQQLAARAKAIMESEL
tara:strand:+ start:245 stop:361 length:117 start_codon:yes stop_codon:yes gene_type:complete